MTRLFKTVSPGVHSIRASGSSGNYVVVTPPTPPCQYHEPHEPADHADRLITNHEPKFPKHGGTEAEGGSKNYGYPRCRVLFAAQKRGQNWSLNKCWAVTKQFRLLSKTQKHKNCAKTQHCFGPTKDTSTSPCYVPEGSKANKKPTLRKFLTPLE